MVKLRRVPVAQQDRATAFNKGASMGKRKPVEWTTLYR